MEQNKVMLIAFFLSICAFIIIFLTIKREKNNSLVTVLKQNTITIPKRCKRLGIIGSTPHPTHFLKQGGNVEKLKTLKLDEFLDIDALQDSFSQLLKLSAENNLDHLIISYLPVYYTKIKQIIGLKTALAIDLFLNSICPQIKKLIEQTADSLDITIPITLIIPPYSVLQNIPEHVENEEQYCQYLIKQFPHMDWNKSDLETIYIINTKKSNEDKQTNCIEDYLSYEYLFERPIQYEQLFIDKQRFHTYVVK